MGNVLNASQTLALAPRNPSPVFYCLTHMAVAFAYVAKCRHAARVPLHDA